MTTFSPAQANLFDSLAVQEGGAVCVGTLVSGRFVMVTGHGMGAD